MVISNNKSKLIHAVQTSWGFIQRGGVPPLWVFYEIYIVHDVYSYNFSPHNYTISKKNSKSFPKFPTAYNYGHHYSPLPPAMYETLLKRPRVHPQSHAPSSPVMFTGSYPTPPLQLLSIIPRPNALSLVYRDPDTLSFTKYVNHRASEGAWLNTLQATYVENMH